VVQVPRAILILTYSVHRSSEFPNAKPEHKHKCVELKTV